ncbi:DNA topoisomerase 3 [Clostridium sp. MD294]|uniref:DNA topoisomerase 3 n=1 Tax=Clostridium sp. MD294 TaxID=97138 RepID=UPI0002CB38D5|nr:DNA topoisomerase 3 [Clostridium sp. MD294]NDO47853.1 DNA topoisomerase III [Clostridium sp. MD294]USF29826.1 DNA topoisomerase 3 [Clostridium sp. MD294]
MRLIIAEKPSVAESIAKVLGVTNNKNGYIIAKDYIVSWCVGHLVSLASADTYHAKYSKWNYQDLPIIPQEWQYIVNVSTKKQFEILKELMAKKEVTELICATDAGREGELIFRLVYQKCNCKKPVKRLWISSLEDSAIVKGMAELENSQKYDSLYHAALCRAKADWLIGINASRLFSCLYHKTLNVGRVMTPTLAFLTEREKEISSFQKQKFYQVEIDCVDFCAISEKIESKTDAEKVKQKCLGKTAVVQSIEQKQKTENPPKLYDLTTLQREANKIYGYTAQQTLEYLQALYEKKLATYPRTDSNYITEDMKESITELITVISQKIGIEITAQNIENIVDSSKVSDHHALLPTKSIETANLSELPAGERNIVKLLLYRLLIAVGETYCYAETSILLECEKTIFKANAKNILQKGWKEILEVFQKTLREKNKKESEILLPNLEKGQQIKGVKSSIKEGMTAPPKHFTEDTLLLAMENASAEEFKQIENAKKKGLGTPATRAGIIEKLIKCGFAERNQKQILPTQKGFDLIEVVPQTIKSAKLTAEWESKLKEIEKNNILSQNFMQEIETMLAELVKSYENSDLLKSISTEKEIIGKCPRCGRAVYEGQKNYYCSGYKDNPPCHFTLWKDNLFFTSKRKTFTKQLAVEFLNKGRVKMTELYSEKKDRYYNATVVMQYTGEKCVVFKLEFPAKNVIEKET